MTTRLATTALLSLLVLGPASAQAGSVDETRFRYTRAVAVPGTARPIVFEPDSRLYAHSRPGFPDLRVVDARGRAVPWRTLPPRATRARPVRVLNTGTQ